MQEFVTHINNKNPQRRKDLYVVRKTLYVVRKTVELLSQSYMWEYWVTIENVFLNSRRWFFKSFKNIAWPWRFYKGQPAEAQTPLLGFWSFLGRDHLGQTIQEELWELERILELLSDSRSVSKQLLPCSFCLNKQLLASSLAFKTAHFHWGTVLTGRKFFLTLNGNLPPCRCLQSYIGSITLCRHWLVTMGLL